MKRLSLFLIITLLAGCSMKTEKDAQSSSAKKDQILYIQGVVALKKGDPKTAVQLFEGVIKLNPNHESAHLLAAKIYLSSKQPQNAIRILAPVLEQFPNNGEFSYLLGIAFKEAGYPKQAFLAAKRSVEIYDAWQKKEELQRSKILMSSLVPEIQAEQKKIK